jgi:hypothetical protein
MAFDKHVTITRMVPSRGYPNRTRLGRFFPTAGLPHVSFTVPAMISVDPDVIPAGAGAAMLDSGVRWGNLYNDLCLSGTDTKRESE